jgi:hypothetical protein
MSEPITEDEVAELNRRAVERTSIIARTIGSALIVVGAVGVLAWLWFTARSQLQTGPFYVGAGSGFEQPSPSLASRVDLLAGSFALALSAAAAIGLGMVLRLGGDYAQARTGGSITGYRAGDVFIDSDVDDEGDRGSPLDL